MIFPVILLLSLQCVLLVQGSATYKKSHEAIKYPGPIKTSPTNRYGNGDMYVFIPQPNAIPVTCRNKTYCTEKANNYPEEYFNDMFKGYKPVVVPSVVTVDPLNRQGDPDEKDDCDSEVTFEPLFHVKDSETGAWRNVIQAPGSDYIQRIRLETCSNPEGSCFRKFESVSGITTFCKQTYNTWEVTVSTADGGTEKIKTELPVCCSCHHKSLDD